MPQKDPAALADAVLTLLEDPDRADKLARNGRAFVSQQFDWSATAGRYAKIFRHLMD